MSSLVRLGIRVRADRAEVALAQLLPLFAAGVEEREVDGDVEFSLYAPRGELPRVQDIRALVGDALVDVVSEPVAEGWERRWHEFLRPVRVGSLVVRPPWVDGAPGDLVIDPGVFFGAGTHVTTQLCLRLLQDGQPGGPLCDWGAGTGVLGDRRGAARLGAGARGRDRAAGDRADLAQRHGQPRPVTTRWLDLTAAPAPWTPVAVANLPRTVLCQVLIERPPERLLASGLLPGEVGEVVAAFGMREVRRVERDGWAAVVLA